MARLDIRAARLGPVDCGFDVLAGLEGAV